MEYDSGEIDLDDLMQDLHQIDSLHDGPESEKTVAELAARLAELRVFGMDVA